MLLGFSLAALFIACGAAPNGALTNRTAAATVATGSFRIDAQSKGTAWTINSPIPEPLGVAQGATVASGDGSRIYQIGGITGAMTPTNKVRVYLPADDTWFDAADIPVSPGLRTFGSALELNGFIYVFGGFDGTNILDTTWIYDEVKDAWFQGANMPGPRFGSAVAADGTLIWVVRGFEDLSVGSESETYWRYDPSTNSWFGWSGGPIPMGRLHAVSLPNGHIHLFGGGFDGDTQWVFNPHGPSPYFPPPTPFAVTDPAIVTDGLRIYVAAGAGPAPRTAGRLQIFNPVSATWSLGPPMPSSVDNTSGAIANGIFYVMGGYDGSTPVSVNYSLPLSSLGATETLSTGSMNPGPLEASDNREHKVESRLDGSSSWSINSPVPEGFGVSQGSTLASRDGSVIYHIGGYTGAGVSNRVRVYSPDDDTRDTSAMRSPWWDVSRVPVSRGIRSYGSAVELNGFIYIFGGLSGALPSEEVLNTTWIYDEANDAWSRGANMPGFRFGSAVAPDGAAIWVIGGYNQFQGADHNVWRYDPKADSYSTGFRDIPRDLGRIHGAWLPDGTVHVFGGNGPGPFDNHLIYDTFADAWSSAPPVPVAVLDPATVTDGTLIYLVGAPDDFPRGPAHTQIFDPARGTWSEGPRLPAWPHFPDWNVDNTSGTIANGLFYVMCGAIGGGPVSFNYSIPLSELRVFNR